MLLLTVIGIIGILIYSMFSSPEVSSSVLGPTAGYVPPPSENPVPSSGNAGTGGNEPQNTNVGSNNNNTPTPETFVETPYTPTYIPETVTDPESGHVTETAPGVAAHYGVFEPTPDNNPVSAPEPVFIPPQAAPSAGSVSIRNPRLPVAQ
jgi:hypothetical protein